MCIPIHEALHIAKLLIFVFSFNLTNKLNDPIVGSCKVIVFADTSITWWDEIAHLYGLLINCSLNWLSLIQQ